MLCIPKQESQPFFAVGLITLFSSMFLQLFPGLNNPAFKAISARFSEIVRKDIPRE
jgi:hypothetical protein